VSSFAGYGYNRFSINSGEVPKHEKLQRMGHRMRIAVSLLTSCLAFASNNSTAIKAPVPITSDKGSFGASRTPPIRHRLRPIQPEFRYWKKASPYGTGHDRFRKTNPTRALRRVHRQDGVRPVCLLTGRFSDPPCKSRYDDDSITMPIPDNQGLMLPILSKVRFMKIVRWTAAEVFAVVVLASESD
jgi:hypothetical protein